jgi:hypothetical protein
MTKYRLHNDVVAVMADAFFQKQIHPAKTIYLLNDIPDHTNDDDWDLIKKLIRYHPRLSAAKSNTNIENYVGGSQGVWSDFINNNSDGDPADPMQMMRRLTLEGQPVGLLGQADNILGRELNHMSHLWQNIKDTDIHQTINYQILKITI